MKSVLGFHLFTHILRFRSKRIDSPVATKSAKDVIVKMSVNRNEMIFLGGVFAFLKKKENTEDNRKLNR